MTKNPLYSKHSTILPNIISAVASTLQTSYVAIINQAYIKLIQIRKPSLDES